VPAERTLRPLPASDYQYAEWKSVRLGVNYHAQTDGRYKNVMRSLAKAGLLILDDLGIAQIILTGVQQLVGF